MFKNAIFMLCALLVPSMPLALQAATKNEVILFYKPGCPFCPYVDSLFNQLKKQNNGRTEFKKINISGNGTYKKKYGFSTVPTVVYIKDGRTIAKHGSNNKTIKLADMQRHMKSF